MSFHGTSSPVSAFTRSNRIGFLSRESSIRKLRSVRRSPDISDTGMLRRPNDSDPLQIGLAIAILVAVVRPFPPSIAPTVAYP